MSLLSKLRNTLLPNRQNSEIEEEMAFHKAMRERQYQADGLTQTEARHAASRRFGSAVKAAEESRDAHVIQWLDSLRRDSLYSIRGLIKRPILLTTGILTLACGIGANLAIATYVDFLLLRPLPVPAGDRVMALAETRNSEPTGGNPIRLRDYAGRLQSVQSVGGIYSERLLESTPEGPVSIRAMRSAGDPIGAFGYAPVLGRTFTAAERDGNGAVVMISHSFWQRRFGGSDQALQQTLKTKAGALSIIGVLGPEAALIEDFDVWLPMPSAMQDQTPRTAGFLLNLARLKPGVSVEQASAELATVVDGMRAANPVSDKGLNARMTPFMSYLAADAREPVLLLLSAVFSIFLLACANLSGLLLTRSVERSREAAIRASIGASRADLVRLFLLEAFWLALPGGLFSLLVGSWCLAGLKALSTLDLPLQKSMEIDARVAIFAVALTLLAALLVGLLPALQASRMARYQALAVAGRSRMRALLVVAQIALSLMLLATATLFLNSTAAARQRPYAFNPTQVVTLQFDLPWDTDPTKLQHFYREVENAVSGMPGVRSAALVDRTPLSGGSQGRGYFRIQGKTLPEESARRSYGFRAITAGYFSTLRIPILRGRAFKPQQQPVLEAVINETMARRYFADGNPVGAQVAFADANRPPVWYEVVGVSADVPTSGMDQQPKPEVFIELSQTYWPIASLVLLVEGDARAAVSMARQRVATVDPFAPILFAGTLDSKLDEVWTEPKMLANLIAGLALVALLLMCIGVYGMLAGYVRSRTREFGIRLAMGATPQSLTRLAMSHGLKLGLIGAALGAALTIPLLRAVVKLIPGGRIDDWTSYLLALAILLTVSAVAAFIPARRAAQLDPVIVLRHE